MAFMGVRISCDMFARNSLLALLAAWASTMARSSSLSDFLSASSACIRFRMDSARDRAMRSNSPILKRASKRRSRLSPILRQYSMRERNSSSIRREMTSEAPPDTENTRRPDRAYAPRR